MPINSTESPETYVIALGKISKVMGLLPALRHNKRTMYAESNIYPSNINKYRVRYNSSLVDDLSPEEVVAKANQLAREAGILKYASNQVMGVEILFSLPIRRHSQNNQQFFLDCLSWTKVYFPGIVLSFDIHLDESAPHAHAIIFPLVNGRMRGSDMVGYKPNLKKITNDFHDKVGCLHGMSKAKKLPIERLQELEDRVIASIADDPVKDSTLWKVIQDSIHKNPLPYAMQLGLEYQNSKPAKKSKSFKKIMTSKGKGSERHDAKELKKLRIENEHQVQVNKKVVEKVR